MKGFTNVALAVAIMAVAVMVAGCGENTGPSNADVVKNYKVEPSKNPNIDTSKNVPRDLMGNPIEQGKGGGMGKLGKQGAVPGTGPGGGAPTPPPQPNNNK